MRRYREVGREVEACEWRPEDLAQAGAMAGWLLGRGLMNFYIDDSECLRWGDASVPTGDYVVWEPTVGFCHVSSADFKRMFMESTGMMQATLQEKRSATEVANIQMDALGGIAG